MSKINKIVSGIQAASALTVMGAISLWAPTCDKLLELTSGKMVPMKCHYTGKAALVVAGLLLLTAILNFFAKKEHKKFMVLSTVTALLIFLLFSSIIGVCMKNTMPCQVTAIWCKAAAAIALIASLVGFFAGNKDGQLPE